MQEDIAIGVDIGGSHVVSAAVHLKTFNILPKTTYSVRINNKAPKHVVLKDWGKAINKTIASASMHSRANIGFAVPGPFDYRTGVAMFKGDNDKYECLYKVSILDELPKYINSDEVNLRFLNDATSFGVGVSTQGKAKDCKRIIVVTLGTGFGSAFIRDGVPLVQSNEVPVGGCLWDKPFKSGISDDYFSTRWCIKRYYGLSTVVVKGVKEIAEAHDEHSKTVFNEFGSNMAEFLIPFLEKFRPEIIVMGGNISKASNLFLPAFKLELQKAGLQLDFEISTLMEDAAIIGSSRLFDPSFWNRVKDDLPIL